MDEIEELGQENEDLKLDIEDLRNEIDDIKEEAFFRSNELRQKLDQANEEIEILTRHLRNASTSTSTSTAGGGTRSAASCDGKEEGEETGSHLFETASQISHDSTQGSKATTATRLELDRAKREIKGLRLELVYAKSKAKEGSKSSSGSSQISSSGLSAVSALSTPTTANTNTTNDNDSSTGEGDFRNEIERLCKEIKFSKMTLKSEKNKYNKEKKRLLQEIDRLQRINMFNTKEISKLNGAITNKDEVIESLKKELGSG